MSMHGHPKLEAAKSLDGERNSSMTRLKLKKRKKTEKNSLNAQSPTAMVE